METNLRAGLSSKTAAKLLLKYGLNTGTQKHERVWLHVLKDIIFEPIFLMLVLACAIYFSMGEVAEGSTMLIALIFVASIAAYQVNKSQNALMALRKVSEPGVNVLRDGKKMQIQAEHLVPGDVLFLEEGVLVPADAAIFESHDFSVNESMLTGESLSIEKDSSEEKKSILKGSLVSSGLATAIVTATGRSTQFDRIAEQLATIKKEQSPLQKQIRTFVTGMITFGSVAFIAVWIYDYIKTGSILDGLLHGLTLAMSVFPEEVPVAFSTFMALGAYQLYQQKVIVANPMTVETLGAATVICTDKTGTLTENKMQLAAVFELVSGKSSEFTEEKFQYSETLEYAMWSSETEPFDAMEIALHKAYASCTKLDQRASFKMAKEYPLGGKPPMMTHALSNGKEHVVAVKGSVEAIVKHSKLSENETKNIYEQTESYTKKGFRVLGVGRSNLELNQLPEKQEEIEFIFLGLVAFYDPPKAKTNDLIQTFYAAGIDVKMITGDHPQTALSIARQIGMKNTEKAVTGAELEKMSAAELLKAVRSTSVFARMFPEAKLKVIECLKEAGEIVAMTGDGVNDGPALKAAHIGIAMGERGSEVAKRTASLILMDDDLGHMVEAISSGRRIYTNLKKAILYIVSIHIPVIMLVTLPLLLNWKYPQLFSPIHVIFFELIMGPTCSIVFEREPGDPEAMRKGPRKKSESLFSSREFLMSAFHGSLITLVCILSGWHLIRTGADEKTVRTYLFTLLIFSNVLLTLSSRSNDHSLFHSFGKENKLLPIVLGISLFILGLVLFIPWLRNLFGLISFDAVSILICLGLAASSTVLIELYKIVVNLWGSKKEKTL